MGAKREGESYRCRSKNPAFVESWSSSASGKPLPCSRVSRALGTYREWASGGLEAGSARERKGDGVAHLFLLRRVTSRLISFHFLSLYPGVSIPVRGRRCVRRYVCARPARPRRSAPGNIRRRRRRLEKGRRSRNSPWRYHVAGLWATLDRETAVLVSGPSDQALSLPVFWG